MISGRSPSLHTSRYARIHDHHRLLITAADLLSASLIGAGLWAALTPLNAGVWGLAAFSSWVMTARPRSLQPFDMMLRAWAAPLLALLLCLVLGALHGAFGQVQGPPALTCLVLGLVWSAVMLSVRLAAGRVTPVPVIGAVPGAATGLRSGAVEYLDLDLAHPEQLDQVDGLLIDFGSIPAEWHQTVSHALSAGVPVWTREQLLEDLEGKVPLEGLHEERLRVTAHQSNYLTAKRWLDVIATLLAAPLLLPLVAVVALVVLCDAGAPVLFFQRRVGQNGRPFTIAKFRTMRRDSEAGGAAFATAGDLRVTRVGRLLRKFRLDELPQFYNVLRGDMSIIGPRPEQEGFVRSYSQDIRLYDMRHWVRPGITGWAQVRQGYAAGEGETLEKLRHDVYYIKHFSFTLDVHIVLLTVWTVLTGFGAR